jgi:hypothetical protein
MNNNYIDYNWPCLQERLNQSYKNYLHTVTGNNESKVMKPIQHHQTIAEKIKVCGNKLINFKK